MKVSAVTGTKRDLLGVPIDALTEEKILHHAATVPLAFSALNRLAGSEGSRRSGFSHPPPLSARAIDYKDGPRQRGWLFHACPRVRATGLVSKAAP